MIDKTAEITRRAMQIPRQFLFSVDEITISWNDLKQKEKLRKKLMAKVWIVIVFIFFMSFMTDVNVSIHGTCQNNFPSFVYLLHFSLNRNQVSLLC